MEKFPEFMRQPCNRISAKSQFTTGIEGFAFDGADGSQMTIWTSEFGGESAEHVHDFDEYFTVVQGQYTVVMEGRRTLVNPGEEFYIPKGIPHGGKCVPGTRTINAFGGKRANRERESAKDG